MKVFYAGGRKKYGDFSKQEWDEIWWPQFRAAFGGPEALWFWAIPSRDDLIIPK